MLEFIIMLVNVGILPEIYSYSILSIFAIFVYQFYKRRKINLNAIQSSIAWLVAVMGLFFSFNYPSFSDYPTSTCLVLYVILPFFVFISGFEIVYINEINVDDIIRRVIYAIVLGTAIHVILNIVANLGNDRWHIVDFFVGERAATNLGALNTVIFSLLPALILERNKRIKIIGLICFAISVVYSFILGTRTQLYLLAIVLILSLLLYLFNRYRGKLSVKTILKVVFGIALLIGIAYIVYTQNYFGIQTKILHSNLAYRYIDIDTAGSDSYRMRLLKQGLSDLWVYPTGRNHSVSYFHNYWLDIGRVGGIIPFILSVLITIISILHMWKVFRYRQIESTIRFGLFGIYLGVFLNYMMEPIMDGYLHLVYRFLFINGMVEALYSSIKHDRLEKTLDESLK